MNTEKRARNKRTSLGKAAATPGMHGGKVRTRKAPQLPGKCPSCGKPVGGRSKACPACGAILDPAATRQG